MFVQVHVCQCELEANVWSLPQFLSTLSFEIESVDDLEVMVLVRLAGQWGLRILLSVIGSGDRREAMLAAGTKSVSLMETSLQHLG